MRWRYISCTSDGARWSSRFWIRNLALRILAEAVESVAEVEKKANAVLVVGKPLAGEKVAELATEAVTEAIEKCEAATKEFGLAVSQSRKVVQAKQHEAKTPAGKEALGKINSRIKAAQDKVDKQKQAITIAP